MTDFRPPVAFRKSPVGTPPDERRPSARSHKRPFHQADCCWCHSEPRHAVPYPAPRWPPDLRPCDSNPILQPRISQQTRDFLFQLIELLSQLRFGLAADGDRDQVEEPELWSSRPPEVGIDLHGGLPLRCDIGCQGSRYHGRRSTVWVMFFPVSASTPAVTLVFQRHIENELRARPAEGYLAIPLDPPAHVAGDVGRDLRLDPGILAVRP